jgi:cystathionine beta-lyase
MVWTKEELAALTDLCLENNIMIISDEIHSDLIFPGYRHIPMASLSEEIAAKTITCMAPSKTFNLAGMSTSFLVIRDRELRHHYNKVLEQVHIGSGNLVGTVALEAAYSDGDEWLDQLMTYLQKNVELVKNYLLENIPAIKLTEPEATYLMWLDCTELKMNNKELKNFMIHEAGLGLNDGPMFGPGGEGFQRMNIAAPAETIAKSLNQLKKAVEKRKSA